MKPKNPPTYETTNKDSAKQEDPGTDEKCIRTSTSIAALHCHEGLPAHGNRRINQQCLQTEGGKCMLHSLIDVWGLIHYPPPKQE